MRPTSAEALLQGTASRPRKLSNTSTSPDPAPGQPVMFFLADQAQMEASTSTAHSGSSCGSNFGVRSMESSAHDLEILRKGKQTESHREEEEEEEKEEEEEHASETEYSRSRTEEDDLDTLDGQSIASLQSYQDYLSSAPSPKVGLSQPMTPVLQPSPVRVETPRSTGERQEMNAPQFIMPEITMPSRRPFTEKGKRIGRMKVMIAGDSGEFCVLHVLWMKEASC
jgi:hypothetical protein